MMEAISVNVAETMPYNSFKEKIQLVQQELSKGRHVEVWDNFIYSAEK